MLAYHAQNSGFNSEDGGSSTWQMKAGAYGHSWLHTRFEASLGYIRPVPPKEEGGRGGGTRIEKEDC